MRVRTGALDPGRPIDSGRCKLTDSQANSQLTAVGITRGTEIGHASGTYSHWNGYKVDVRPTTCVSNYITSRYAYYGVRAEGATMYRDASGNMYARESSHWDITYYACGC